MFLPAADTSAGPRRDQRLTFEGLGWGSIGRKRPLEIQARWTHLLCSYEKDREFSERPGCPAAGVETLRYRTESFVQSESCSSVSRSCTLSTENEGMAFVHNWVKLQYLSHL